MSQPRSSSRRRRAPNASCVASAERQLERAHGKIVFLLPVRAKLDHLRHRRHACAAHLRACTGRGAADARRLLRAAALGLARRATGLLLASQTNVRHSLTVRTLEPRRIAFKALKK
jgi:hypothetical protein